MGNVVAEFIAVRASIAVTVTVEEPRSVIVGETVSIQTDIIKVPVTISVIGETAGVVSVAGTPGLVIFRVKVYVPGSLTPP